MAGYKGIGVVFIRKSARELNVESIIAASLTAPARETWSRATATSWVPIEHATEIFERAAPLLFVNAPNPIRQVGRALARDNLGGVYRHIVRLLSVGFLMKQTAVLWRAYHNAGEATVDIGEKIVDLKLTGYRDLPERFRECMCGWIAEAVEMCGGQNARVLSLENKPDYLWRITWR